MDAREAEFGAALALANFNVRHAGEIPGVLLRDNDLVREKHRLAVVRRTEVHAALAGLIGRHEDVNRQTNDTRYSLLLPFGKTHPTTPPAHSGDVWASAALRYLGGVGERKIVYGGLLYYVSHLHPPEGVEHSPDLQPLVTFDKRQVRPVRWRTEQTPHEDKLPSNYPTTLATHIVSARMDEVHAELHAMELGLKQLFTYIGGDTQDPS